MATLLKLLSAQIHLCLDTATMSNSEATPTPNIEFRVRGLSLSNRGAIFLVVFTVWLVCAQLARYIGRKCFTQPATMDDVLQLQKEYINVSLYMELL